MYLGYKKLKYLYIDIFLITTILQLKMNNYNFRNFFFQIAGKNYSKFCEILEFCKNVILNQYHNKIFILYGNGLGKSSILKIIERLSKHSHKGTSIYYGGRPQDQNLEHYRILYTFDYKLNYNNYIIINDLSHIAEFNNVLSFIRTVRESENIKNKNINFIIESNIDVLSYNSIEKKDRLGIYGLNFDNDIIANVYDDHEIVNDLLKYEHNLLNFILNYKYSI